MQWKTIMSLSLSHIFHGENEATISFVILAVFWSQQFPPSLLSLSPRRHDFYEAAPFAYFVPSSVFHRLVCSEIKAVSGSAGMGSFPCSVIASVGSRTGGSCCLPEPSIWDHLFMWWDKVKMSFNAWAGVREAWLTDRALCCHYFKTTLHSINLITYSTFNYK